MAGLSELVEAATEGMRKTQSADPIEEHPTKGPSPTEEDGHQSDSAVAPTRERKKGELSFPGNLPRVLVVLLAVGAPHLVRARVRERIIRGNSRSRMSTDLQPSPPSLPAGVPWTEDEHRLFLLGLQKLGKVRGRTSFTLPNRVPAIPLFLSGRRAHVAVASTLERPIFDFIRPVSTRFRVPSPFPASGCRQRIVGKSPSLRFTQKVQVSP